MKRTLIVLALAVLSLSGCRAMDPYGGYGCGEPCGGCCDSCGGCCDPCDGCCESCHPSWAGQAPQPCGPECCDTCGREGNLCECCGNGGNGCCFDRYCGSDCGPGYHQGPYDCSACNSPHWGVTGYRHPHGYVDGRGCLCNCQGRIPGHCKAPGPHCPCCGHGYCCTCCGPPAPGCPVCCCGASGDHHYNFQPGPPVAQTAYPYYTLRGPRDFLLDNPPSIGPY
jgi:hypothetical protein